MRFLMFVEERANMGIVSPEGKIYKLPGATELAMMDYLRVNHIIDRHTSFGKLLIEGWVFFTVMNKQIDVTYRRSADTVKLINKVFAKMHFDEIHFDDPNANTWHFKKYDDFIRDGI